MSERRNAALDLEGIELDFDDDNEPSEVKRIQFERYGICLAVAEALESIYGKNLEEEEPDVVDIANKQSNLVARLDFGEDLKTELIVPYEGRLQIGNPEINLVFSQYRDRFRRALSKFVKNPDKVFRERC